MNTTRNKREAYKMGYQGNKDAIKERGFVTYLDFGAVGDGVTEDFKAIYEAHEYANENNLPVITNDDKTYYIHDTEIDGEAKTVRIRTDVTWGTSKFIIDDTDIEYNEGLKRGYKNLFKVISDYEEITITDPEILEKFKGVGEGTKKFELALGYPALIVVYNEDHRVYHRAGASYVARGGQSSPQHEVFLIDGEGNIDESTPFMFNYDHVTKILVIRTDVKPLTIKGGIFTTKAPVFKVLEGEEARVRGSYIRNISVNRSYTTVEGVEHYVEGVVSIEDYKANKYHGVHYCGFYTASYANDVLFKNCILTGRFSYHHSTYEFQANHINKIRLVGCIQSNFEIDDPNGNKVYSMVISPVTHSVTYWGIGGTNFCKNMEYIDSKLSRFDAHQGLYNGKIVNSSVNFMEIIGKGELIFDRLNWCSASNEGPYNNMAYLRGDYGSTWDGTIIYKDCTLNFSPGNANVFYHSYTNWNFGYECHFPNLIIDNPKINGITEGSKIRLLTYDKSLGREPNMHLPTTVNVPVKGYDGVEDATNMNNNNMIVPPKFLKVINNTSGQNFYIPKSTFFDNTEVVGFIEEEM